jgi:hypothetical protein
MAAGYSRHLDRARRDAGAACARCSFPVDAKTGAWGSRRRSLRIRAAGATPVSGFIRFLGFLGLSRLSSAFGLSGRQVSSGYLARTSVWRLVIACEAGK